MGGETLIGGCEADDARYLIRSSGQSHWHGRPRQLGRWSFRHLAEVSCAQESCSISTNLSITCPGRHDCREDAPRKEIESVLPDHDRDVTRKTFLQGEIAADLRDSITATSYDVLPNKIAVVWVDYGKIATLIRVRIRTEIQCDADRDFCTIDDNAIVFVPYDEHDECGYLNKDKDPEGLLF